MNVIVDTSVWSVALRKNKDLSEKITLRQISTLQKLVEEGKVVLRQNGVQGSNTDFLICAAANRHDYSILTADKDFEHFSQYIPINLAQ